MTCPFCARRLKPSSLTAPYRRRPVELGRIALFACGTTLGSMVLGCQEPAADSRNSATTDEPGARLAPLIEREEEETVSQAQAEDDTASEMSAQPATASSDEKRRQRRLIEARRRAKARMIQRDAVPMYGGPPIGLDEF